MDYRLVENSEHESSEFKIRSDLKPEKVCKLKGLSHLRDQRKGLAFGLAVGFIANVLFCLATGLIVYNCHSDLPNSDRNTTVYVSETRAIYASAPQTMNDSNGVAFTALIKDSKFDSETLRKNSVIVYDYVETNIGNGYNSTSGMFVAPYSGTYAFTWSVCVLGKRKTGSNGEVSIQLVKNRRVIFTVHSDTEIKWDDDCTSGFIIENLAENDHVFTRATRHLEGSIKNDAASRWAFSGWKLF